MIARILNRFIPSENRLELDTYQSFLLENLPHIVFELDSEYRWTLLNKNWALITGFRREDSLGINYAQFIHPEDRQYLQQYLQNLHLQQENNDSVEARILTRFGEPRWTEVNAVLIADESGQPRRIGTITDITERIVEEEQLHANNRSLSGLLNDLSGMVYRCRNDKFYTMEYLSGGCKRLTGYAASDIVNNSKLSWDSLIHPEDRDRVWAEVQSGVREGQYFDMTYRMYTSSEKIKWVWERGKGIFSEDGELLGLEGYITDVTSDKQERDRYQNGQLYSALTGLPKLSLFLDRLSRAIDYHKTKPEDGFLLLVIQFHKLMEAFDQYGEVFEAEATLEICTRMLNIIKNTDSVTCIKPDRYVLLIEHVRSKNTIDSLATRLIEEMRAPILSCDKTHFMTCSVGISDGNHANNKVDSVMHNAVVAVDHAAAQGGSRFEVYDPDTVDY